MYIQSKESFKHLSFRTKYTLFLYFKGIEGIEQRIEGNEGIKPQEIRMTKKSHESPINSRIYPLISNHYREPSNRFMTSMMMDREVLFKFDDFVQTVVGSDRSKVMREMMSEWLAARSRDNLCWKVMDGERLVKAVKSRQEAASVLFGMFKEDDTIVRLAEKNKGRHDIFIGLVENLKDTIRVCINL